MINIKGSYQEVLSYFEEKLENVTTVEVSILPIFHAA